MCLYIVDYLIAGHPVQSKVSIVSAAWMVYGVVTPWYGKTFRACIDSECSIVSLLTFPTVLFLFLDICHNQ